MDRLTSLAVFVRAVDLGSFTAAGAALHLSSQQVGKHIQELEARLGVRLLARTTRRQSLTDFGKVFYERARIILDEVEAAESLAAQTRDARLQVLACKPFKPTGSSCSLMPSRSETRSNREPTRPRSARVASAGSQQPRPRIMPLAYVCPTSGMAAQAT